MPVEPDFLVLRVVLLAVALMVVQPMAPVLKVIMQAVVAVVREAQVAMPVLLAQLKEVKGVSVFLSQAHRSEVVEVEEDALH